MVSSSSTASASASSAPTTTNNHPPTSPPLSPVDPDTSYLPDDDGENNLDRSCIPEISFLPDDTVIHHPVDRSFMTEDPYDSDTYSDLSDTEEAIEYTAHLAVNPASPRLTSSYPLPPDIAHRLSHNPCHQVVQIPQSPVTSRSGPLAAQSPLLPEFSSPKPEIEDPRELTTTITPGIDDTPIIHRTLETLTKATGHENTLTLPPTNRSEVTEAISRHLGHAPAPTRQTLSALTPDATILPGDEKFLSIARGTPVLDRSVPVFSQYIAPLSPTPPGSAGTSSSRRGPPRWVAVSEEVVKTVDPSGHRYPVPRYLPAVLRWWSLGLLGCLEVVMAGVMIWCAVKSRRGHEGMAGYEGTIDSSRFFVFRILPGFLAAFIILYTQSVTTTLQRVLPFLRLASSDLSVRTTATFQDTVQSPLLPSLSGPLPVVFFNMASYLMNFVIPLHTASFTLKFFVTWRWTGVVGVLWTVISLYLLHILSLATLAAFLTITPSGLLWDTRSIADIIPLMTLSNVNKHYITTTTLTSRKALMDHLESGMTERLGYWAHEGADITTNSAMWYAFGRSFAHPENGAQRTLSDEKPGSTGGMSSDGTIKVDVSSQHQQPPTYLPWPLQVINRYVILGISAALYVAFLAVSFNNETKLADGFPTDLRIAPNAEGFSPASFVFAFIPGLLGQIAFLLFISYEMTLRVITPWARLSSPEGAEVEKGLLADYAACLPGQVTLHALRNHEFRLAFLSSLSTLFLILPVLSGSLLLPLSSGRTILIFPSLPILYTIVALLSLYLVGLTVMAVPGAEYKVTVPHGVGCLAEVLGFVAGWEGAGDPVFSGVRRGTEVRERLQGSKWGVGVVEGGIGVRRVKDKEIV